MPHYGQITGTDNGMEGIWLIELDDDGAPISPLVFISIETMPDVVLIWSVALPIGDKAGVLFTDDEPDNLAMIMMLCSAAELKRQDAGSESPLALEPHSQC